MFNYMPTLFFNHIAHKRRAWLSQRCHDDIRKRAIKKTKKANKKCKRAKQNRKKQKKAKTTKKNRRKKTKLKPHLIKLYIYIYSNIF